MGRLRDDLLEPLRIAGCNIVPNREVSHAADRMQHALVAKFLKREPNKDRVDAGRAWLFDRLSAAAGENSFVIGVLRGGHMLVREWVDQRQPRVAAVLPHKHIAEFSRVKHAVIVDDLLRTGATIVRALDILAARGCEAVDVVVPYVHEAGLRSLKKYAGIQVNIQFLEEVDEPEYRRLIHEFKDPLADQSPVGLLVDRVQLEVVYRARPDDAALHRCLRETFRELGCVEIDGPRECGNRSIFRGTMNPEGPAVVNLPPELIGGIQLDHHRVRVFVQAPQEGEQNAGQTILRIAYIVHARDDDNELFLDILEEAIPTAWLKNAATIIEDFAQVHGIPIEPCEVTEWS